LVERGALKLIQAPNIEEGAVTYLGKKIELSQAGYRDKFQVRTPDSNESTFFSLPDDGRIAVVETFRTAFDDSGKPFRLTVTVYPADRNQFVMNVGRVPDAESVPGAESSGGG
jgi:GntR family transcriptional regulator